MKKRIKWIAGKLLRMGLLLFGVSVLSFLLASASPVDPLQTNIGQAALGAMSPEQITRLESYWQVGTPALERYLRWGADLLRGDWGTSLLYRRPVLAVVGERLANSAGMLACAWIFSGVLGLLLGMLAGLYREKTAGKLIHRCSLVLSALPTFWLGLVLLVVFAVWLRVLPIGLSVPAGMEASIVTGGDRLRHAILPGLTLSLSGAASITLHTREKMTEIMASDYFWFAKARGESTMLCIWRHGLRNLLLPAMTLQFACISEIIGGSLLAEQVFSYPGLGQAAVTAGLGGDFPLLLGVTMACSVLVFLGNFAADLLYGVVDPRIRKGGSAA